MFNKTFNVATKVAVGFIISRLRELPLLLPLLLIVTGCASGNGRKQTLVWQDSTTVTGHTIRKAIHNEVNVDHSHDSEIKLDAYTISTKNTGFVLYVGSSQMTAVFTPPSTVSAVQLNPSLESPLLSLNGEDEETNRSINYVLRAIANDHDL